MNFDPLPIIIVILFLISVFGWVRIFNSRVEPWLRAQIGRMLGVEIVWRFEGFRRGGWSAIGEGRPGTGCLVTFWEIVVVFGLMTLPIFLALLVMGLIMFAIYD